MDAARPGMTPVTESLQTALRLHQAGDYAEAGRIYREILREYPDHADALQLLGLIEHQAGRHAAAAELIGRAVALAPGAAVLHNNLGEALRSLGRLDEAAACYAKAVALDPAFADAHYNLGVVAGERGETEAATAHYRQALALRSDHAAALNNLGYALAGKGELEEAETCLRRAIACRPGFAEAHNNLGTLLMGQSRQAEARREFEQALSCKPGFALALANLGALAQEEGRPEEALEYYRKAREAAPDMAGTWVSSGMVLAEQGRWREAREAFAHALKIRPSDAVRILHGCVLPPIAESKAQMLEARRRYADCLRELSERPVSIRDPAAEVNAVPFYLAYQGLNDRELQRSLARLYQRACPSLEYRAPHCDSPGTAARGGRIRIGFVSRVIGRQSVARVLMSGLISRLSRERFDVSVYSFPHGRNDDIAQMQACADRVVMLPPVLAAARERLVAERLDVLCHVDIGMEPLTYFLAFARLAPVQFATWLHPVTTGIRNVDYFLSSSLIEPERAEAHYSEQLVQLATLPTWYERPKTPAPLKPRAELGLNEAKTQYVCPQSPFKIHPDFDALLAAILRADPNGEVVLLEGRLREWARSLLARIRAGAPDVAARLRCIPTLPPADFEHLLASADVLLDPLHWSGGITTLDALAFGTPVVTLPSAMMRGRVTYGCYRMMGITECVAGSEKDYVELAVRLGTDRGSREAIRAKILERNAVLYRNDAAVAELERFVCEAVGSRLPAARREEGGSA
jgi:predicted O-linked N-acetylglucosamine transferase (SPINDLY family)